MKLRLINFLFLNLLSLALVAQTGHEVHISGSYSSLTFKEFVMQAEREYDLHFFFKESWINSVQVSLDIQNEPISTVMQKILADEKVGFTFKAPGTIYILPKKVHYHLYQHTATRCMKITHKPKKLNKHLPRTNTCKAEDLIC